MTRVNSLKRCTKPGEEYNSCGSACPATCDNVGEVIACPAVCVSGCFCRKGLVRDNDENCIPPGQCPKCENGTYLSSLSLKLSQKFVLFLKRCFSY
ncbi:hypothetical protein LAZ67_16001297 [Cordylochernes scorpioides]|uniref:TIL domain-containing protein n=1 Tax=Cordylochernes scorpioides TaxID=51811 RepID=A0ABY6LG12_9ARAC|nr:hypothetical protein LAZ67_16001297 [Cordylochernes scorpioides]